MWRDTTPYSRGERGKKEPTTWTASYGDISITVTCGHIDWDGEWIAMCHQVNMRDVHLKKSTCAEEAQMRAVLIVKNRLQTLHDMVSCITF